MKKLISLAISIVMVFSFTGTAYTEGWDDLFGGLTSLFKAEDEVTYGVGEVAETDGVSLELINVMESTGNSYYTPESGNEYILLEFKIENHSEETIWLSTVMSFSTWSDDTLMTISFDALATAMLSGKYQLDCAVEPEESVTGVIGYEVPTDWKKIKVQYTKETLFGETLTFVVDREAE